MQQLDDALEQWLRTEGAARYKAFVRSPDDVKPAAQVFANLRERHERRLRDEQTSSV